MTQNQLQKPDILQRFFMTETLCEIAEKVLKA